MGFNREIKGRDFSPASDFRIFRIIFAHRNRLIGHIRNMKQQFFQFSFNRCQFAVNGRNLFSYFAHILNILGSIPAFLFCLGNHLGCSVFLALQYFCLLKQFSSLLIQIKNVIQIKGIMSINQVFLYFLSMLPNELHIQHS